MKGFIDQMAHGIFAEKPSELAYDEKTGQFAIYRTKEQAEEAMKTAQPKMWPWRVAPIRINNGGFVPS